jgi:hypothetical protein
MTNWPEDPRPGTDAAEQYRARSQDQAAPQADAVEQYRAQPQNWAYEAPQQYAPGYPQAPVQAQSNGLALASMILGITSIVFCWWGIFTLAQVVLAIVFGVVGLGRAKAGAGGRGQALAGIICGSVGAFFYLIFAILTVGIGFLI